MELIYSMRRRPLKCEPPRYDSAIDPETVRPLCTISTANIIAFSSPTELDDVDGDTWGGHVYVCDLDTPWDTHKVTSTTHPVSALEWDMKGEQLLVATTVGEVAVYGQRDYLLNDWQCLYNASFTGEHIMKATFFHNGRRIVSLDKKPEAPITERLQVMRAAPTLKGFGGVACEGVFVITATGLCGVVAAGGEGGAPAAADALRPARDHITAASLAHKSGSIVVAVLCGARCVRCFVCTVSSPPLTLKCQPAHALHLTSPHSCVSWSTLEEPEALCVAGSTLSLWKCVDRPHPVHKMLAKGPLQGSTTPGGGQKQPPDTYNTAVWQKSAAWAIEGGGAVCVSAALLPQGACSLLATTTHLHLLHRDTHHLLCSRAVQAVASGAESPGASPRKKTKYGAGIDNGGVGQTRVSHARVSASGGVAVCVDSLAQIHVYRLTPQHADTPTALSLQHATSVLEYCLVSGYDSLDYLLTLKQNHIEPLYERLTESFQRQPASFQQYYYHAWLKMRMAVCRLSSCLQSSVSWLSCMVSCAGVLATLAAAARHDDHALDDDDDKSVSALEAKGEVPCDASALQAMRGGLQRGVDVALTAIAQLATHHHQHHGYEMWTEAGGVSALRRIIVCARASGRAPELVWRALPRLAQDRHKHDLYEDCAAIAAQLQTGRVWEALPRCSVSAPHNHNGPLYLEYGVEPEYLRYVPEPPPYAQCDAAPPQAIDSIRYMYLGGGARAARWRACGRCGARALPHAPHAAAAHPLQRAHDARFLPRCRCGAKWTMHTNV